MLGFLLVQGFITALAITAEVDWRRRQRRKG